MSLHPIFFLQLFIVGFAVGSPSNYTGHSVLRVPLKHLTQLVPNYQSHLENGSTAAGVEVLWTGKDGRSGEEFAALRVPPHKLSRVRRSIPTHSFLIDDLSDWFDELKGSGSSQYEDEALYSQIVPSFRLDRYHPLDEIYQFIKDVSKIYNFVTVFDLGTTHEDRKIKGVEIVGNSEDKSLVWIDANTHAREWITPAVALFLIEQIVMSRLRFNFVIIPVLNPDGYSYTWTNDRLWRKNRRPSSKSGMPDVCNGVDLNRNYDIAFGGQGSSNSECSHLYQGPDALSEPETSAVANVLWTIRKQTRMFISLHSFNQLWAAPFAYTKERSDHYDLHMSVLSSIQAAVKKSSGIQYKIGPLSTSLYVGSGFAMDWAYTRAKIVHSYLAELRDNGQYGFLLPVDQIIPTATETWEGIKAGINRVYFG